MRRKRLDRNRRIQNQSSQPDFIKEQFMIFQQKIEVKEKQHQNYCQPEQIQKQSVKAQNNKEYNSSDQSSCFSKFVKKLKIMTQRLINYLQFDRLLSESQILQIKDEYFVKKRYPQNYYQTYQQREKTFGHKFYELLRKRQEEQIKKGKIFWQEFKRFICCEGSTQMDEEDEILTAATDYELIKFKRDPNYVKKQDSQYESTISDSSYKSEISIMKKQLDSIHSDNIFINEQQFINCENGMKKQDSIKKCSQLGSTASKKDRIKTINMDFQEMKMNRNYQNQRKLQEKMAQNNNFYQKLNGVDVKKILNSQSKDLTKEQQTTKSNTVSSLKQNKETQKVFVKQKEQMNHDQTYLDQIYDKLNNQEKQKKLNKTLSEEQKKFNNKDNQAEIFRSQKEHPNKKKQIVKSESNNKNYEQDQKTKLNKLNQNNQIQKPQTKNFNEKQKVQINKQEGINFKNLSQKPQQKQYTLTELLNKNIKTNEDLKQTKNDEILFQIEASNLKNPDYSEIVPKRKKRETKILPNQQFGIELIKQPINISLDRKKQDDNQQNQRKRHNQTESVPDMRGKMKKDRKKKFVDHSVSIDAQEVILQQNVDFGGTFDLKEIPRKIENNRNQDSKNNFYHHSNKTLFAENVFDEANDEQIRHKNNKTIAYNDEPQNSTEVLNIKKKQRKKRVLNTFEQKQEQILIIPEQQNLRQHNLIDNDYTRTKDLKSKTVEVEMLNEDFVQPQQQINVKKKKRNRKLKEQPNIKSEILLIETIQAIKRQKNQLEEKSLMQTIQENTADQINNEVGMKKRKKKKKLEPIESQNVDVIEF